VKKIFLILITGLLWCNVGMASEAGGVREPGHDQKCFEKFEKKKIFEKELLHMVNKDEGVFVVYAGCTKKYKPWGWDYSLDLDVDKAHEGAYKACVTGDMVKYEITGCHLFSIDDVIVWGKDAAFIAKIEEEAKVRLAGALARKKDEKKPITPESIAGWDTKCDKGEDFIKYVATVEGCIGIKSIGKPDKSKKKLVIHLHGDYKGKQPNNTPKFMSGYSKLIPDDANFFFIARPGHKFSGRVRSAGKWKNSDSINQNPDRVAWKKGWGSIKLITQTIYRLKEFYQPEKVIVIGFSGGAQDVSVMSGKIPGLIDVGILGGCDCFVNPRGFWTPREFIKTIPRDMPIIMISGEKDTYIVRAKAYYKIAKDEGLNIELHLVPGGHEASVTLLGKQGKDIVKAALQ